MRYVALGVAVILDFLQFALGIAFTALQFMTPVGGGVAGAAGAAGVCYSFSGSVIEGITNTATCALAGGFFGAALSAFAMPLGMAVNTALSLTLGAGVLFLLAWDGAFYWEKVAGGSIIEVLPVCNFVPAWSYMVWRCIRARNQEIARAAAPVRKQEAPAAQAARPNIPAFQPNRFSDITPRRAANENATSYANAA